MKHKGNSLYERRFKDAKRSFDEWFENTLDKEEVVIDGVKQWAVLQDQSQSNNKELSDDKYIITENESNIEVGSYVNWRNASWMVFTDEYKTIPTHKQAKIKETNHTIKWMVGDKICGNGKGYDAYIQNQTLYTLGISTSGNNAWIVNAKMMMYLPDNEETRAVKLGQRIIIGGAIFQIMFKDYVSRRGIINYLLEQDFYAEDRDNLELGIADYYPAINGEDAEDNPVGDDREVVIDGVEKARIGSTYTFKAGVFYNGEKLSDTISEWTIADTEDVATIVEQDNEKVTIRIVSNFQKVGSVITIIAKTEDGVIGSKPVNIVSPY